jgi:hypothetical protein
MKLKTSISTLYKISNSKKDFILYRLNEDENRIIDFILTDDLSRFRAHFNNKFKLVTDVQKQIKNFTITL